MKNITLPEYNVRQVVDLITHSLNNGFYDNGLTELKDNLLKQSGLTMQASGRMT